MSHHTPGPWKAHRIEMPQSWDYLEISGPRDENIAEIDNVCDPTEIEEANARLIAAAPDLLEACKAAISSIELHGADGQEFFDAREKLLAAIAKAEPQGGRS